MKVREKGEKKWNRERERERERAQTDSESENRQSERKIIDRGREQSERKKTRKRQVDHNRG